MWLHNSHTCWNLSTTPQLPESELPYSRQPQRTHPLSSPYSLPHLQKYCSEQKCWKKTWTNISLFSKSKD